jgi:hypothetical protein
MGISQGFTVIEKVQPKPDVSPSPLETPPVESLVKELI